MGQAIRRFQFLVEAGRHEGVAGTLDAGVYRIGSALDADIVLADRGLAPVHGTIEFKKNAVRVAAMAAPIRVNAGDTDEAITLLPGTDRDLLSRRSSPLARPSCGSSRPDRRGG